MFNLLTENTKKFLWNWVFHIMCLYITVAKQTGGGIWWHDWKQWITPSGNLDRWQGWVLVRCCQGGWWARWSNISCLHATNTQTCREAPSPHSSHYCASTTAPSSHATNLNFPFSVQETLKWKKEDNKRGWLNFGPQLCPIIIIFNLMHIYQQPIRDS